MFFWGYIEDAKREIVSDFNISVTPINTATTTKIGTSAFGNAYVDTDTYTTGGTVSSKTEQKTIWTFDIGDTSFKLLSETMHLKNGDFVVIETYFRDGVYYIPNCIYNATKNYAEPNNFPCYLEKISEPAKPNNLKFKLAIGLFIFGFLIPKISLGISFLSIVGGYYAYKSHKADEKNYKEIVNRINQKNEYIRYHNAEYKEHEAEIASTLLNLKSKLQTKQIEG